MRVTIVGTAPFLGCLEIVMEMRTQNLTEEDSTTQKTKFSFLFSCIFSEPNGE